MPKKVDHQARREQIAQALWRVTATHGLEAVSLRHVAAEAGVSMGLVQHYFRTKDQMLRFALDTVSEHVEERLRTRSAHALESGPPRAAVEALLVELLPLDEQRRLEAHVAVAFGARSAVVPELATHLREGMSQLRGFLAAQIRAAQHAGQAPAQLNPDREAIALLALVDGLSVHTLMQYCTAETALAVFRGHLDNLFSTG